jgi:hypothetical protein
MISLRQRSSRSVAAVSITLLCGCIAAAQSAPETTLKAGYLYNLAKFTEWPADGLPAGTTLTFCVAGDAAVAQRLDQTVARRRIAGHPMHVRQVTPDGALRSCHIVYAAHIDAKAAAQVLDAVKGSTVMTVSDLDRFAELGGTAHLYIEDGRMKFAINVDSAQRSRLHLSAQLLSLAKIVKDDPNASTR